MCKFQSTHSRGVRLCRFSCPSLVFKFQSTHSRGVRLCLLKLTKMVLRFQSTHSRGVRPSSTRWCTRISYFNPRTHEECDKDLVITLRKLVISIHALTRSAT